jgi:ribonuclease G
MSLNEELLINVTPRETRVALVENGLLQEVLIERSSKRGVLGNIYKGRVQRVMPGMQAAFVDIGLERTAFLHANDIAQFNSVQIASESIITELKPQPSITSLVHEGQEIVVQVIKDPIGSKGARLTTEIWYCCMSLILSVYRVVLKTRQSDYVLNNYCKRMQIIRTQAISFVQMPMVLMHLL